MKKSNKIEFVSVVVPVYNEEGCLQELIDRTLAALDGCNRRFEFIMVDNRIRQVVNYFEKNRNSLSEFRNTKRFFQDGSKEVFKNFFIR